MKLGRIETADGDRLAVRSDEGWSPLPAGHADLRRLLEEGPLRLGELLKEAEEPVDDPPLAAPLRPGKIIAIGLNYLDHVRESKVEPPAEPLVFAKFPSTVIGPEEAICLNPAVAERVDWEGELALVVGHRLRDAELDEALASVFGYTIANDVSARNVQFADGQWIRGKNLDTFCPLGPVVVTADEIPDPQTLTLHTAVNGETVQDSTTTEMIFGVAELLAFCSRSFTLEPGDVMLTGTPWGCGEFMTPRRSLVDGDRVEITISGIGTLANPVRDHKREEPVWTR